jgi:hypothetical protein
MQQMIDMCNNKLQELKGSDKEWPKKKKNCWNYLKNKTL